MTVMAFHILLLQFIHTDKMNFSFFKYKNPNFFTTWIVYLGIIIILYSNFKSYLIIYSIFLQIIGTLFLLLDEEYNFKDRQNVRIENDLSVFQKFCKVLSNFIKFDVRINVSIGDCNEIDLRISQLNQDIWLKFFYIDQKINNLVYSSVLRKVAYIFIFTGFIIQFLKEIAQTIL